jgi:hypothetical protein
VVSVSREIVALTTAPVMWNSGAMANTTSPSLTPIHDAQVATTLRTLPWVFMAPFGGPVVPEVYVRNATSSQVGSTKAGRRPAYSPINATRSPSGAGASRSVVAKTRGSFLDW